MRTPASGSQYQTFWMKLNEASLKMLYNNLEFNTFLNNELNLDLVLNRD